MKTVPSGRLRVKAEARAGQTFLADALATPPFHVGSVHRGRGMAELIVQSVGPGLFPSEELESAIDVGPAAALTILGQGATKIYPSVDGGSATSRTEIHVREGGTLWWLPGEVIPFRNARFEAQTQVGLERGARFALWDIVTPGRTAMGEANAYHQLDLRLRLEALGKVVLMERGLLDPVARPVAKLGRQGPFPCAGSLVLFGYALPADLGCDSVGVWFGADGRDGLTIVRGLAHAALPLRDTFLAILHNLTESPPAPDLECQRP